MNVTVAPGALAGSVRAPSSKSEAHRLLVCAALADGTTDLDCTTTSADIDATARCLAALGAGVARTRLGWRVRGLPRDAEGRPQARPDALLDCGESGSTLRFLLPVAAALGAGATMDGQGRLPERPLSPLYEELQAYGAELGLQGRLPLSVSGRLRAGTFELPGNVSSQYVTGLLLAAPVLREPVRVVVSEPVESRPYVDLTVEALGRFGVGVTVAPAATASDAPALAWEASAPEGCRTPGAVAVGGDWSNAAFWLAAGALGGQAVEVTGLDPASAQGDRAFLAMLAALGAQVGRARTGAGAHGGSLRGREVDVSACPDLVPPLAAVAAVAEGTTRVTGAERLRLKESDRLATVSAAINSLGGEVEELPDGLLVRGRARLAGGTVDAANDHRIAMMAAVLAARCEAPVTIVGAECVAKSYPAFFEDLVALGGTCTKEGI